MPSGVAGLIRLVARRVMPPRGRSLGRAD